MEIKQIAVKDLKPWPRNPRTHDVDSLVKSIEAFGFRAPLVVNQTAQGYMVEAGHGRLEAAIRLGIGTLPCVVVSDDEKTAMAYAVADNRQQELAEWDLPGLKDILQELDTGALDMEAVGFSEKELEDLMTQFHVDEGGNTDDDAVPDDAPATCKTGDLWLLGDHRLLCGDSTKAEDVALLMDGQKADMVFTDPPYAIFGSSTGVSSDVADDKMVRPFFRDILAAAQHSTKPFAHIYVCCDWRSWSAWWEVAKTAKLSVKNCIVWDKGNAGLGAMFRPRHELVLFAVNHIVSTVNASGAKTGQHTVSDENVWAISREPSAKKEHNAQKPVALIERALEASKATGDSCIDLFLGSGSTLIACEKLGRKCYGMEIDCHYCDVIIKRWEDYTGGIAEKTD